MKVVLFSHAHPSFSKGGGELAAYYLWQRINEHPDHQAWFFGRADAKMLHGHSDLAMVGERDYLVAGNAGIPDLTATTRLGPDSDLARLLAEIQPDVVHFHHYVHIGIEIIRIVKNVCLNAKIFVTLHEYIAICMHNGQMVKTDMRLCHEYHPRHCHQCFPDIPPENFFLRERYIKSFFNLVDRFISPSEFLKDRYVQWGLEPDRILVIENGIPPGEKLPPRPLGEGEVRGRFAYFGQINPYKGVDVILEAFLLLPKEVRKQVTLEIFGSALQNQTEDFQAKIGAPLKRLKDTVRLHRPFGTHEVPNLMREIDWVIMGSIWWASSPLVIQEAFKFGRPLISDIGGMAEKVKDDQGSVRYRSRDPVSLSNAISNIFEGGIIYDDLFKAAPRYTSISDCLQQDLARYHVN